MLLHEEYRAIPARNQRLLASGIGVQAERLSLSAVDRLRIRSKDRTMRVLMIPAAAMLLLTTVAGAQAGCITGAVVGGVAGHMVGHGKVGAAAGCAVGHHNAKKKEQQSH